MRALTKLQDHLIHYGGHAHAAGLAIREENLAPFRKAFNVLAREELTEDRLIPSLSIHGELPFDDIDGDCMADLAQLEPFGMGNRRPNFLAQGFRFAEREL